MSRMIDADALIAQMEADAEQMEDQIAIMFTYAAINDVKHAPTIEERKTGKWERHYSRPNVYADWFWHCSCCGYKTPDNWANKWNYCPNCGASMMEGE